MPRIRFTNSAETDLLELWMARLRECLDAGDYTTAHRLAHTIKGTAATLGVDHLAAMAAKVESVLRASVKGRINTEDVHAELEAIQLDFVTLKNALQRPARVRAVVEGATRLSNELRRVIAELDALLAQSNSEAITLFEQHAEVLQDALGNVYDELAPQIKQFKFKEARETLSKLLR